MGPEGRTKVAAEILQRDDLSVFVVAGVPKRFEKDLRDLVGAETEVSGGVLTVDREGTEWIVSKLRENGRRRYEKTPASAALWRAYRALSAARYHLQDPAAKEEVQSLRGKVERLWNASRPRREASE
jgi:hypothetical protein